MKPMAPATRAGGNSSRMMPKASGKMAPAAPWMTRPDQDHAQAGAQRTDQRAHAQGDEHADDDLLLADGVAHPAQHRRGDGRAEQVGGQQPAGAGLRGVQRLLELGDGRDDQRLQEAEGQGRGGQHGEGRRRSGCAVRSPSVS